MMMMLLRRKGQENRIGRRLMVLIITFSSFLALIATAYQLYHEYGNQRADMDGQMQAVEVFLPPIAASVWSFDDRQIILALDALTRLSHIEHATVATVDGRNQWQSGAVRSERLLMRRYDLKHEARGETRAIATLELTAGLDGIYRRLLDQAITILISNALKTFLVAAFMYVIFSRVVTRRIEELARNAGRLVPESLVSQASLFDESLGFPDNGDEIDRLRWSFDNIARQLHLAVGDLHDRHQELHHEIQERTRAEQDLQSAIGELSRINAELERFAYVAAHDLQEPVRGLVSFSQLLERRYRERLDDDGREYLHFIVHEALRMSNLVRDLLEYSRAGGITLDIEAVECGELVGSVLESLSPSIDLAGALVEVDQLPRVQGDRGQLRQLFLNLLGNALKYSGTSTRPLIRVTAEREADAWRFAVADNGIGIDPQYHDYVFEVFRRLHTGTAYPGTGIGLAICKRIVESHGGHIWLQSTPERGTTFFFTLPDGVGDTPLSADQHGHRGGEQQAGEQPPHDALGEGVGQGDPGRDAEQPADPQG